MDKTKCSLALKWEQQQKKRQVYCQCGCGEPLKIRYFHKWKCNGIPKYKRGHHPDCNPPRNVMRGKDNPAYKDGRKYDIHGYVEILNREHPKNHGGYVKEHRLAMEKYLGRYLESWEQVHHINGIKDDNRIENLELVVRKKHFGKVKCPYCHRNFLIK